MLKQDVRLPLLDMAWSRHKMTEFFNTQVLPLACPGREVTSVTRKKVAYEPGRQAAVLYSLDFEGELDGSSRWSVVSFASDDSLQEAYSRHYGNGAGRSPSGARSAVSLPEHRCLVEFFPFDWKLPALAGATDTLQIASALGFPAAGEPQEVKTLRYVPHKRCVLLSSFRSPGADDGAERAVVKVYPAGPLAGQTLSAMTALHPQAKACGIVVPRPLQVLDGWNVVLMEEAPGLSLKKVLKQATTPEQVREPVARAAAALAAFHGLRFDTPAVRSFASYLQFLEDEARLVLPVAPSLAQQARSLIRRAARSPFPAAQVPSSLIHGDFAPSQLLIAEDRVAVVDFDNLCLGDPAMDVGNFMAKLHRRAVARGQDYYRGLSDYFVAEYGNHVHDNSLEERARVYQVLTLVRTALHTFRRAPRSYAREGPGSLPVLLLQEAASCLAS